MSDPFDDSFSHNSFGDSFGDSFSHSSFDDSFSPGSFGDSFSPGSFDDSFFHNSLGGSFSHSLFGDSDHNWLLNANSPGGIFYEADSSIEKYHRDLLFEDMSQSAFNKINSGSTIEEELRRLDDMPSLNLSTVFPDMNLGDILPEKTASLLDNAIVATVATAFLAMFLSPAVYIACVFLKIPLF